MSVDTFLTQTEVITWVLVTPKSMPDADKTVMVNTEFCFEADDPELVWYGWWDGEVWRDASSGAPITSKVLAWADVPSGFQNYEG